MLRTHFDDVFIQEGVRASDREVGGTKSCEKYRQGSSTLVDDYHGYALATAALKVQTAAGHIRFVCGRRGV